MLILSRNPNQSIMIGHEIEVMIIDVRGDRVRIGITAPGDIPVHRHEVYDTIYPCGKPSVEPPDREAD